MSVRIQVIPREPTSSLNASDMLRQVHRFQPLVFNFARRETVDRAPITVKRCDERLDPFRAFRMARRIVMFQENRVENNTKIHCSDSNSSVEDR